MGFAPVGTNATKPVDVLAVLERDRKAADDFRCTSDQIAKLDGDAYMAIRAEVSEAHEAVAELIAQGQKAAAMLNNVTEAYVPVKHRAAWHADAADFRAALAAVQP